MDQSTHAHTDLTSVTNHVYEMIKQGEQGGRGQRYHEYEQVDVSPGTDFLVTMAANEMPYPQPLPTIPLSMTLPTSGDVGVARDNAEEDLYDNIPGDQ